MKQIELQLEGKDVNVFHMFQCPKGFNGTIVWNFHV